MSVVISLGSVRERKKHVEQIELVRVLSLEAPSEPAVGPDGRLDAELARGFQLKADALGWDVEVARLDEAQFRQLADLMHAWALQVRQRIGVRSVDAATASGSREAYLQAVAAGRGADAKLPDMLAQALRAFAPR